MALAVIACDARTSTYTLYRTSTAPGVQRVHVATFDADDSDDYNQFNCFKAAELFAGRPSVAVRYWCEKGRYHA